MQREEFSERAQTQKMDTNQGERARLENRRRFSGELAEGALQFFALGTNPWWPGGRLWSVAASHIRVE